MPPGDLVTITVANRPAIPVVMTEFQHWFSQLSKNSGHKQRLEYQPSAE
jgi:hypothetical protein